MSQRIIRYKLGSARRGGDAHLQPDTVLAALRIIDPNCYPEWLADAIRMDTVIAETTKAGIVKGTIRYTLPPAPEEDRGKTHQVGDAILVPGTTVAELTLIDPNCTPEWWAGAIRYGDMGMIADTTEPQRDPATQTPDRPISVPPIPIANTKRRPT